MNYMNEQFKTWSIYVLIALLTGALVLFGSMYLNKPERSVKDLLNDREEMVKRCKGGDVEIQKTVNEVTGKEDLEVYCVFSSK